VVVVLENVTDRYNVVRQIGPGDRRDPKTKGIVRRADVYFVAERTGRVLIDSLAVVYRRCDRPEASGSDFISHPTP